MKRPFYAIIIGILLVGFIFMCWIIRDILLLLEDITVFMINKTEEVIP